MRCLTVHRQVIVIHLLVARDTFTPWNASVFIMVCTWARYTHCQSLLWSQIHVRSYERVHESAGC